jgi:hypothetical protein
MHIDDIVFYSWDKVLHSCHISKKKKILSMLISWKLVGSECRTYRYHSHIKFSGWLWFLATLPHDGLIAIHCIM